MCRSLECVAVGVDKDWQQIASSCPAIVNTAVQTDDGESYKWLPTVVQAVGPRLDDLIARSNTYVVKPNYSG